MVLVLPLASNHHVRLVFAVVWLHQLSGAKWMRLGIITDHTGEWKQSAPIRLKSGMLANPSSASRRLTCSNLLWVSEESEFAEFREFKLVSRDTIKISPEFIIIITITKVAIVVVGATASDSSRYR